MPFETIVSNFNSVVSFLLGNITPLIVAFETITVVYSPEFEFVENVMQLMPHLLIGKKH